MCSACAVLCAVVQVLVVSEVDRVHPILHPLLRGDIEKQAGRLVRCSATTAMWIHLNCLCLLVPVYTSCNSAFGWHSHPLYSVAELRQHTSASSQTSCTASPLQVVSVGDTLMDHNASVDQAGAVIIESLLPQNETRLLPSQTTSCTAAPLHPTGCASSS
jgi:hypothetical protein